MSFIIPLSSEAENVGVTGSHKFFVKIMTIFFACGPLNHPLFETVFHCDFTFRSLLRGRDIQQIFPNIFREIAKILLLPG